MQRVARKKMRVTPPQHGNDLFVGWCKWNEGLLLVDKMDLQPTTQTHNHNHSLDDSKAARKSNREKEGVSQQNPALIVKPHSASTED